MRRVLNVVASVAALAICSRHQGGSASTPSGLDSLSAIDSLFQGLFPSDQPGAAVLILKDDEIIFDKGYGIADIDTKVPIDGNTFFNIASVSKQFTACAILQLAEQGLLSLEDSVAMYYPEFSGNIWKRVKIKHLLSHCSGVPDARTGYTREEKIKGDDALSMEYMRDLDVLNFEPGTSYEYINPTFVLAGDIVSKVSGMPFTEYMREHIFKPAGMDSTLYFESALDGRIPHMAHGYEYEDVTNMPEEHPASLTPSEEPGDWYEYDYGEETFFATRPDGGIYTSTHEFVEWERAIRSARVISEESRELAQSPITKVTGSIYSDYQNRENTWYGMGWFIEPATDSTSEVIYHTGDNGGFKILAARYPESNVLLLIFANRSDWDRYAVMQEIERDLEIL